MKGRSRARAEADVSPASKLLAGVAISAAVGGAAWAGVQVGARPSSDALSVGSLVRSIAQRASDAAQADEQVPSRDMTNGPRLPTGAPPSLGCADARRIVAQVDRALAQEPPPVDPLEFAQALGDWLDPHGMWSAGPGAAPRAVILAEGPRALEELHAAGGRCSAAEAIGRELAEWMPELRGEIERAMATAPSPLAPTDATFRAAAATPFEDGPVQRPARELARRIGLTLGTVRGGYGTRAAGFVRTAVDRFAPDLVAARWTDVVLAAAVRAYVPLVDPHGAWAPGDETTSIYDIGLEGDPPIPLWEEMTRTALGIRVDHGARTPLVDGDLVLAIDDVETAGLSVEQSNQLALVPRAHGVRVSLLRDGELGPRDVVVGDAAPARVAATPSAPAGGLRTRLTPYGAGAVLVVTIPDVPDDLGDRVEDALEIARADAMGVLLDLRGNGGGSTDGALDALGPFLPGAPLFPMRRRDGSLEVDRAPMPLGPRWDGPVAVLVDEETASAAEMITGAIAAYGRGVVVGRPTYGKGCAQEYLDDDAGAGLLRLTTLVFSRPDGEPLQRTGVVPDVTLPLLGVAATGRAPAPSARGPEGADREASLPHAPIAWRGPDVRAGDPPRPEWPSHGGHVGPCAEADVCRALMSIGARRAAAR